MTDIEPADDEPSRFTPPRRIQADWRQLLRAANKRFMDDVRQAVADAKAKHEGRQIDRELENIIDAETEDDQ